VSGCYWSGGMQTLLLPVSTSVFVVDVAATVIVTDIDLTLVVIVARHHRRRRHRLSPYCYGHPRSVKLRRTEGRFQQVLLHADTMCHCPMHSGDDYRHLL
jgi:hypothetical protein